MRNILVIFKKELKSYFASPIAYLLLAIFAVIFGFFFYRDPPLRLARDANADDGPRHAHGRE